ncbi:MAG: SMP-30/gluconolactonase/LRE family protein [Verrucomicrobia bacterium]|nr:SMP-30/gluconolactonase/LRE family protein [Verrucomicrobiota bacterium]MBI3869379.1 SMP-30/gluconolactonase/LRE family protein [Verrucomicrobiota bacterium]
MNRALENQDNLQPAAAKPSLLRRRQFLGAAGLLAGTAVSRAWGATNRDWTGNAPTRYPDPDVVVLDPRFEKYKVATTSIQRLWQGSLWAEGTAWCAAGQYLVFSDIPNDRQLRWLEDDGRVSVMRKPAGNSNGNTFDYQGRQISCEHGNRRVVRYELNGSTTVLADHWQGKRLNAPNDVVVHPDGGIWFTDPGYGSMGNYEGNKGELLIKEAIYRIDPASGKMDLVADTLSKPNGICFSPDYKRLYVADSGGTVPKPIWVWDVADGKRLKNGQRFVSMAASELSGSNTAFTGNQNGLADGIRCDIDGNVWAGAGWVGDGYDGVHIFAPDGARIGLIRLPEICANLCFGGPKRNRLFMAGSTSLYAVHVETQGAHIT